MGPAGFDALWALFPFLFVGVVVVGVVMSVRRAKKLNDAGIDPLDPETDIAIRFARSRAMAPPPAAAPSSAAPAAPAATLTEWLAELDALHRAGTISGAERDAARAKLLGTL
jgi:hypothetical protein